MCNYLTMLKAVASFLFIFLLAIIVRGQELSQGLPDGLKVGEMAPDFNTVDYLGNKVSLKKLLKRGPVVLMFYRGVWCPYCNKQLMQLQDSLELINELSGTVIAVTPETVESIGKTVEKTNAEFRIIHDEDLCIMKAYDVAYELEASVLKRYKKTGINLKDANGKNGANLPVPATYIIGQDGKIVYAFFDPDHKKRATVRKILENL